MKFPGDRQGLLRLIPVFLLLHAIEAAAWVGPTVAASRTGYPKWFRLVVPPVSVEQFAAALLLIVLLAFAAVRWGEIQHPRSWGSIFLSGLQAALLLNAGLVLLAALILGGYAAGLGTALLVQVPFSIFLLLRAWKGGWIGARGILLLIPLAFLIRGPIFFAFLFIAGFLVRLSF